ncbi:MAG TPA: hypothetical protein PK432_00790 [Candidatus Dojkabacteria bacterium]|nr:hypothetical protein [Candidatus Dojkabacteria bacterium]HPP18826.1 hypothetical protein [Candidatus Dojkabacteria bacterium]
MRQNYKIYASQITEKVGELISGIEKSNPGETNVESIMQDIIDIALPLSVLAAALLMAFAAYKMITSQGNPDKLKDAREQIGNAITGLVFILVSAALLLLIGGIFLPK